MNAWEVCLESQDVHALHGQSNVNTCFQLMLLAISVTSISNRCMKSSIQLLQTPLATIQTWNGPYQSDTHRMPPFQQIRPSVVNHKFCYCEMKMSRSNSSTTGPLRSKNIVRKNQHSLLSSRLQWFVYRTFHELSFYGWSAASRPKLVFWLMVCFASFRGVLGTGGPAENNKPVWF